MNQEELNAVVYGDAQGNRPKPVRFEHPSPQAMEYRIYEIFDKQLDCVWRGVYSVPEGYLEIYRADVVYEDNGGEASGRMEPSKSLGSFQLQSECHGTVCSSHEDLEKEILAHLAQMEQANEQKG